MKTHIIFAICTFVTIAVSAQKEKFTGTMKLHYEIA
ncbi:hypothetical protein SAMN05216556_10898 [Aequorivita viscosa]|nr:hypothetical protein SAMN05216556_10898 [Aequorivita viscosa]